ncbi:MULTISPECIES: hypothetical protein [unclassified Microcoleus]|uniref:hypothetical protein n=1 Tax=unclassified Microcoleus TaxID=2642155 RepID=UPI002FD6F846
MRVQEYTAEISHITETLIRFVFPIAIATNVDRPPASPNDMKSDRSPTSPFRDTAVMPCPYP